MLTPLGLYKPGPQPLTTSGVPQCCPAGTPGVGLRLQAPPSPPASPAVLTGSPSSARLSAKGMGTRAHLHSSPATLEVQGDLAAAAVAARELGHAEHVSLHTRDVVGVVAHGVARELCLIWVSWAGVKTPGSRTTACIPGARARSERAWRGCSPRSWLRPSSRSALLTTQT